MSIRVESVFKAPGPHPNGIQATPDGLWILDQQTNQASLVSYDGEVIAILDTDADRGSGITDSGASLWIASTYSHEILEVDRSTGRTLSKYPTPGEGDVGAHGLDWRDGTLWTAVPSKQRIFEIRVEGFETIHSIPTPGNRAHGLGWVEDALWCVDTTLREIHRLDPESGALLGTIELPEPHPEPHGMTMQEGEFWYCDATTGAVCRIAKSR